jgi:hypothetical protein
VNRVIWDLRHERLASAATADAPAWRRRGPDGPLVVPGTYTVRLTVDGTSVEETVEVVEDPRLDVPADTRRRWTETLLEIARLYDRMAAEVRRFSGMAGDASDDDAFRGSADEEARERWASLESEEDRRRAWRAAELLDRIGSLYRSVSSWTGEPTADQRSRLEFYREMAAELGI